MTWPFVKLASIVAELESGGRPKGGVSESTGEIPSLGGEHINSSGGFNLDNVKRIPSTFFRGMRTGKVKAEDILIIKDGATIAKTGFVGADFPFKDAAIN